jgi:hypothetical protein
MRIATTNPESTMPTYPFRAALAAAALLAASNALAQDKCSVKAVVAGQSVEFTHCAIAVIDGKGATIWFSATPLSAKERSDFEMNSYAKDRDEAGKPRSMMHLMFCPGGGQPVPNAAAVKSVEMSMALASSPIAQRQWVFELPKDSKDFAFKSLSGSLKAGGRLVGQATGTRTSDGLKYSWDAKFDLAVPKTDAAAGPGCGG